MANKHQPSKITALPVAEAKPMRLNEAAIDAARRSLDQGAVTPSYGPCTNRSVFPSFNNSY